MRVEAKLVELGLCVHGHRAHVGRPRPGHGLAEGLRHVNSAPGFRQQPAVINAFSDLILELYGQLAGVYSMKTQTWRGGSLMRRTVTRWGNSLAIRLPRDLARDLNLESGSPVNISSTGSEIVITPIGPHYSLEGLVSKITNANRHAETGPRAPAGKEVW